MIKRVIIGDVRITFTIARIVKVIGVNSQLDDGQHILMWDFDDTNLEVVKHTLKSVQIQHHLSAIYILETKENTSFIAFCLTALSWRKVVSILAQTKLLDWNFFKYGVYRGHFTLRVSPKGDRKIKFIEALKGSEPPNCVVRDLKSLVRYETLKGG